MLMRKSRQNAVVAADVIVMPDPDVADALEVDPGGCRRRHSGHHL
jgi:hypothetical protein